VGYTHRHQTVAIHITNEIDVANNDGTLMRFPFSLSVCRFGYRYGYRSSFSFYLSVIKNFQQDGIRRNELYLGRRNDFHGHVLPYFIYIYIYPFD
jgi:hypothetical protein